MANRPNPDGWKGGSEDFGFVRILDGHRGINLNSTADEMNADYRRNERHGLDDADLSGEYE